MPRPGLIEDQPGPADLDAVIIGSGPNGLAAAITLARAGRSVLVLEASETPGGGLRTAELTLPGYQHDVCSAIHPMAAASPFFQSLDLQRHRAELVHPQIPFAHPLDGGRAGLAHQSLDETVAALGDDGKAWSRLVGRVAQQWDKIAPELLGPVLHIPKRPLAMAGFGVRALPSAQIATKALKSPEAKALFAGVAAHSFLPLSHPLTAAFGLLLAGLAHGQGWPAIAGGSERLSDAMVSILAELGVEVHCSQPVRSMSDVPTSKVVLFDLSPDQMLHIVGDELPDRYRKRLSKFRAGPGVFKLDYALSEQIPWTNPNVGGAGTVHVGGTIEEINASETQVHKGQHPEKPFVLVAQQSVFDTSRTPDSGHTLWAYCHVPNGSTVDMTEQIENQIERFAPGFRDTIVARHTAGPRWYEDYNANNIGGDISGGSHSGSQLVARPTWSLHPYRTPNPRFFLCSASTPPGGGVHGMSGHRAALDALSSTLR